MVVTVLANAIFTFTKMKKKPTHGGARKNAGRKPKEPTKTIRVPISKLPAILKALGKV
jgi:hypothetical protein